MKKVLLPRTPQEMHDESQKRERIYAQQAAESRARQRKLESIKDIHHETLGEFCAKAAHAAPGILLDAGLSLARATPGVVMSAGSAVASVFYRCFGVQDAAVSIVQDQGHSKDM